MTLTSPEIQQQQAIMAPKDNMSNNVINILIIIIKW